MTFTPDLPGDVPPALADAIFAQTIARREVLVEHLVGGTSADWLSDWFKRAGTPVGATTIKRYRRSL